MEGEGGRNDGGVKGEGMMEGRNDGGGKGGGMMEGERGKE